MSFAVVLEGMCLVAYLIILCGGKRVREGGWGILSLLILLAAAVQAASMSIVVCLYFACALHIFSSHVFFLFLLLTFYCLFSNTGVPFR